MPDKIIASAPFDLNKNLSQNKIEDHILLANTFYRQGKEYFGASTYLLEARQLDFMDVISSNLAFACELYLKSILFSYRIDPNSTLKGAKRHNLKDLYGLLPVDEQNYIKDHIALNKKSQSEFELSIQEMQDAFARLRYSCETSMHSINFDFLYSFAHILDYIAQHEGKKRNPSWHE